MGVLSEDLSNGPGGHVSEKAPWYKVSALTRDTLAVSQAPAAANDGDHPIELVAQGSATAEGRQFTARAQRMTYAQAKDLIVLEGTGRIDAQLWRQVQVASPTSHASARRILFWPTRNEVQV